MEVTVKNSDNWGRVWLLQELLGQHLDRYHFKRVNDRQWYEWNEWWAQTRDAIHAEINKL